MNKSSHSHLSTMIIKICQLFFVLLILVTISCNKKKEEQKVYVDNAISLAANHCNEIVFFETIIRANWGCTYDYQNLFGSCLSFQIDSTYSSIKTYNYNYGAGCLTPSGQSVSGELTVSTDSDFKKETSEAKVTFNNFYLNNELFSGEYVLYNQGNYNNGNPTFLCSVDYTVVKGNSTRKHNLVHCQILWKGSETCDPTDDEFIMEWGSGNVELNGNGGSEYNVNSPIYWKSGFDYPYSGVVEFQKSVKKYGAFIDYGDGSLDENAIITTKYKKKDFNWNMKTRTLE